MATPSEIIASIDAAIAGNPSGVLVTEFNGRRIERMSLTELMKVRDALAAQVARTNQGSMFMTLSPRRPN